MENEVKSDSCYNCEFLKHSLTSNNVLVYLCQKWQLKCNRVIPYKIVKDSIGRECPFLIQKQKKLSLPNDKNEKSGFNIIA